MPSDRRTGIAVVSIAALAFSACLKPPRRELEVVEVARPLAITPFPTSTRPPATPTPTATESPTPMATPSPAVAATPAELPSLLTKIDNSTRPSVAAAMRLVEEGRVLLGQGAFDPALDRFEHALAIDPSSAYGYYFLARLHLEKRSYDQATAFADKSAMLSARDDPSLSARAYVLQGAVFEQVGRFPDARVAYRRALAADAGNGAAQAGMARLGGSGGAP